MNRHLVIRPITLRQARDFVEEHHRHHRAPQGGAWAIALVDDIWRRDAQGVLQPHMELVGVAICGRPVSRMLQRDGCLEIVRVCVLEGVHNGCSMLYGGCCRVARAMGYQRIVTYTMQTEAGKSLQAAGFMYEADTKGGSWSCVSRPRTDKHPTEPKKRWGKAA